MLTVYGINNCDSCRKARKWLDGNSIEHEVHDLRIDGINIQTLERWCSRVDWQRLLNTRSRTWREIPPNDRSNMNLNRALALMLRHPTLIKRPVIEGDEFIAVGFSERRCREILTRLDRAS